MTAAMRAAPGPYGLAAAMLLALVYFLFRNHGLYPVVFADEWLYSSSARLMPLAESMLPSYLYLALFRQTNVCGAGFLECARVLNAVMLVAAAPFLYLIARRVCSQKVALLVAILCILSPISSFTIYFMPEIMYFLGFCVLAWIVLNWTEAHPLAYGLATGAMLGVMSVVKVHALFLMPALLVYMVYLCRTDFRDQWLSRLLWMAPVSVAAMLGAKTLIGYAVAGDAGMTLFGTFYGNHATQTGALDKLLKVVPLALTSFKGHALALVLMLAVPVAGIVLNLVSVEARQAAPAPLRRLQVFALLVLGAAMGLTVMFTASLIESVGPQELLRLHTRYYDFVFPLLIMAAAGMQSPRNGPQQEALSHRLLVGVPLGAMILWGGLRLHHMFRLSLVDGPDIYLMASKAAAFRLLALLALLVLVVWVWRRKLGASLFVFVFVPVLMLFSEVRMNERMADFRIAKPYDLAGQAAARLPAEERAGLVVMGEPDGVQRTLFHIDTYGASYIVLPEKAPVVRSEIPRNISWLLVVGKHDLPPDLKPEVVTKDYMLVRVAGMAGKLAPVPLATAQADGTLSGIEGLSGFEGWGAWTDAKEVKFHFAQPLPAKLSVAVNASAFGPNIDKDFIIAVGDERQTFKLKQTKEDRQFAFNTDGKEKTITIIVPQPASPKALGQGPDGRLLGLALHSIEVGTR